MADQVVGAAGHQLRLVLLCHRGAPVAPDVHAGPDREPQPESEEDEPEAGAPRIRVEAVTPKGSQADQEDHDDNDHRPDTQLAGPRDAAPLHREGRRRASRSRTPPIRWRRRARQRARDSYFHSAGREVTSSAGSRGRGAWRVPWGWLNSYRTRTSKRLTRGLGCRYCSYDSRPGSRTCRRLCRRGGIRRCAGCRFIGDGGRHGFLRSTSSARLLVRCGDPTAGRVGGRGRHLHRAVRVQPHRERRPDPDARYDRHVDAA